MNTDELKKLAEALNSAEPEDLMETDLTARVSDELRRLSAELAECKAAYESQFKELHALKASLGEPVAWRYQDARGHYRYCGYKAGFDTDHPLLKPIALYAITKDKP